jgi:formylglycine-generating enzyme required for sulfatase activity
VLLDFGLAKGSTGWSQLSGNKSIQAYTPNYAPLEQIQGSGTDARSDLYSLAATLYHLITGVLPPDALKRCLALTSGQPDPLPCANDINEQAPASISAVLYRAMALQREDRYESAAEMLKALRDGIRAHRAAVDKTQESDAAPTILAPRGPELHDFEFDVAATDETGAIGKRRKERARLFEEDLTKGVKLEMVLIPAGSFLMGSDETETGRTSAEGPQHRVALPSFFMSRYPITQAQWKMVSRLPEVARDLDTSPFFYKGDNLPVEQVSWEDAKEFCDRLALATKRKYRLPSESEWEYACRAGTTTPFHFGPTVTPETVNYHGRNPYGAALQSESHKSTSAVDHYGLANAFGLSEMHGNVWEWCADVWHENYEGAPSDGSAWSEGGLEGRNVLRGGAWGFSAAGCRSANRYKFPATGKNYLTGFRIALIEPTIK